MDPVTIGDWMDRLSAESVDDRVAFTARFASPVLVAQAEGGSRADLKAQTAESTSTEMIDVAKIKSSAIASRDARVYRVARRAAGAGGISVGRARDSDVWIDDTRVSKRHAAFETGADGLVLHDLSSTNGTFVNERKLDKDERTAVKPNDVVRFGRATKMHFLDPVGFFDYLLLLRRFGI